MGRARLVTAGILLAIGLALLANRWFSSRIEDVAVTSVAELRAIRGRPKHVTASPAIPFDPNNRRYRARSRDELYTQDPRTPVPVADVATLRERGADLAGAIVTLGSAPAPKTYFFEKKQNRLTGKKESTATSLYAPVEGTAASVWIVSERLKNEQDPKANDFLARTSHTGRVVSLFDVFDGTLLADAYAKKGGRAIPPNAIALDTEEPIGKDDPVEVWIPIVGADDVWVVYDSLPSTTGVVEAVAERATDPALDRVAARGRGLEPKARVVLRAGDVDAFRAKHPGESRVSWIGAVLLLVGVVLLGVHRALG